MRIADGWTDFEVLDCDGGEKLERWGDYVLLRPDPQVIWKTGRDKDAWKHLSGHYHRSQKGGGDWEIFDLPEEWQIGYHLSIGRDIRFNLRPFKFKHTGVFPEQAANWELFSKLIVERKAEEPDREVRILNLFAYTGGATMAAAAAGASVTHVDASKGMVGWAKDNAALSGLSEAPIRWLVDDCVKFVEREIRRGNTYDAIIMDPPSYGRGPKGEIWKIEDSIWYLVNICAEILSDDPLFFLINSYTTGLQPAVLSYMLNAVLREGRTGGIGYFPEGEERKEVGRKRPCRVLADEIGLPVAEGDLVLPCGASGIAVFTDREDTNCSQKNTQFP